MCPLAKDCPLSLNLFKQSFSGSLLKLESTETSSVYKGIISKTTGGDPRLGCGSACNPWPMTMKNPFVHRMQRF